MPGKETENSHVILKDVLGIAQICGLFSVYNIRAPTPDGLKVKWLSWKILYTLSILFATLFCTVTSLVKAFSNAIVLSQLVSPLFYLFSSFTIINFIWIGKNWIAFIQSLCNLEKSLLIKYNTLTYIRKKLRITIIMIYSLGLCEHGLCILNYMSPCIYGKDTFNWETYFKRHFHHIYYFFPYSFILSILIMILNLNIWIIWNFGDVFIICLSRLIATRFKQISNTVESYLSIKDTKCYSKYKCISPITDRTLFCQIREDYNRLALVCKNLNQLLSNLIITCYIFNLLFILIQLFNSMRQMETVIEITYFFFSFGFVIFRTVSVSIYAASINEESKYFLPILNSVPTELYSTEVQRLIMQIHTDALALTGHNFFKITRGTVLKMAAAVITYELVIIQFNQETLNQYRSNNATF